MTAAPFAPDRLAEVVAEAEFPPGWHVRYLPSVPSTQDVARDLARSGVPNGTVVVADYQSAGRGRQGRQWVAPPGSSLLLSIVFRADAPSPVPQRYTATVSVALAEAVECVSPALRPAIKWPNDLMLGGRKVAGVLAEGAWDGERLTVIVGAGTNVRLPTETLVAFPTSTSLELESGLAPDRGNLLAALVDRLAELSLLPAGELFDRWRARLWGRGQRLRLRALDGADLDRVREVVVLGVDADGALRVRLDDGSEARTTTAELIL